MVWPNPEEVAVLTINGQDYRDWESVLVRHAKFEAPFYTFRFTCSEGIPLAKNWSTLRIVPGMQCTIELGGIPAFTGLVVSRQVYYDARRHYIEIQGVSNVSALSTTSVVHQTGEFKDTTIEPYVRALIKPFAPMQFIVEGGQLPQVKFPRINIGPGTSVLEAIETPLRALGSVALTSDINANLVAAVGPTGGEDTVVEGDVVEGGAKILEAREIIYSQGIASGLASIGQYPANDKKWAADTASIPFLNSPVASMGFGYAPQVIPLEMPAFDQKHLENRVAADHDWQTQDEVTVFATVRGWMRPSGGLWDRNQTVRVISPMLVMDGGMSLQVKTVTFTQDDKTGTRTQLELVNAMAMNQGYPQTNQ